MGISVGNGVMGGKARGRSVRSLLGEEQLVWRGDMSGAVWNADMRLAHGPSLASIHSDSSCCCLYLRNKGEIVKK